MTNQVAIWKRVRHTEVFLNAVRNVFTCIAVTVFSVTSIVRGDELLTFERHIRPILKAHCFDCHGATDEVQGDLDLRLRRFMTAGGDSGPAIVPGEPESSYLVERIRNGEMPPSDKKVSAEEIETIERWIRRGAVTARAEPEELDTGLAITPEEREFWSFQPLARPELPILDDGDRVRTPVDAFILARLQEAGLNFAPDADDLTLLMRAHFDLVGLPPSRVEVEAYAADASPDKYEAMIDALLESPRYGERWARHWLDVAGYADTEGFTPADADRPWAYRYRDYVIKSLNADKPFDVFVLEQLAGDELVEPPHTNLTVEQIEKLAATGFLRMASDGTGSGANSEERRNQTVADTIKIVSTSLLGLSVGCAGECHDHRYDPIRHTDYYQLRAIFDPALDWQNWRTPQQRLISLYSDEDRAVAAEVEAEAQVVVAEKNALQKKYIEEELEKELNKFDAELREKLRIAYVTDTDKRSEEQQQLLNENPSVNISGGTLYQYNQAKADELTKFDGRIGEIRAKKPAEEFIRALTETSSAAPPSHLFHRGDYRQPKQVVTPAGLSICAPPGERFEIAVNAAEAPTTGRRLAYARWLINGSHPLVGRVLVNRVWMHHFGRGIVGTPGDFGTLGQRPTHPELLDWLAVEFAANGWSLKQMHKQIMLSTVYRQSARGVPTTQSRDPDNLLYWKKPVIRLDAEAIYDRILSTSGVLKHELYGPATPIAEDDAGQVTVGDSANRRGVYVKVKRTQPVALFKSFDAPVMEVNCERRTTSTVATQSLMLMNSNFALDQSRQFAERVRREAGEYAEPDVDFDSAIVHDPGAAWRFGYGEFDSKSQLVKGFTEMPHWTGSAWRGGSQLPDSSLGWVLLNAGGGHTGDARHSAIRLWIAPADGVVSISGRLHHPSENGDGVSGHVVSSSAGLLAEWVVKHDTAATNIDEVPVQSGDSLDFVADCRGDVTSDSFGWSVKIVTTSGDGLQRTWNSESDFHGPREAAPSLPQQVICAWNLAYGRPPREDELKLALDYLVEQFQLMATNRELANGVEPGLQAMTNLCHVLLGSNEFIYVD